MTPRFPTSMTPGSTVNAGGRLASPSEKTFLDHLFRVWLMAAWIAFVYALMVDCILGKGPLEKSSIIPYALEDRSLIVSWETHEPALRDPQMFTDSLIDQSITRYTGGGDEVFVC